jgi:hypothetical protein
MQRGRIVNAIVLLLGAIVVAPTHANAADTLRVQASAGLGGIAKAGRWTPIHVTIENSDALTAELVISWGDATIRRKLALASPGKRAFDLYMRTAEVERTMHLRIASAGTVLHATEIPLQVLRQDEPVTLCALPADGAAADTSACVATTTPDLLPRSLRGYEAADRVTWPAGERTLPDEQRNALDAWQQLRRLEEAGDLTLTPQPTRPSVRRGLDGRTAQALAGIATASVLCFTLGGLFFPRRRTRLALVVGSLVVATIGAIVAVFGIGRLGPGRAISIQHASLLQQLPGRPASVLSISGIAQFPAFEDFTVSLANADASLEPASTSGRAQQLVDEDGHPILTGTFGLGSRKAFTAEAITDIQLLTVATDGRTTRLTNQSQTELRECRFAGGFSVRDVGVLKPGASVTAEQIEDFAGPLFTCTSAEPVVAFTELRRPVRMSGTTVVAVYRTPEPIAAGPSRGASYD